MTMKKSMASCLRYAFCILCFSFIFCQCFAVTAHAYVDPATTAMLTQIVSGIIISLGVVIGVFRRKIMLFFQNIRIKMMKKKIEKQNRKDS